MISLFENTAIFLRSFDILDIFYVIEVLLIFLVKSLSRGSHVLACSVHLFPFENIWTNLHFLFKYKYFFFYKSRICPMFSGFGLFSFRLLVVE